MHLPESLKSLAASLWDRLRLRVQGMSLPARIWWGAGLFLILGVAVTPSDSCFGVIFIVLLFVWLAPTVCWGLYWLWVKLTYRISVRLFLSYVLIGVLPFPMLLGLAMLAGYIVVGQYASAEFGDVVARLSDELVEHANDALAAAEESPQEARETLARGPALPADMAAVRDHVDWIFAADGESWKSHGASRLTVPTWASEGVETGPFWYGEETIMAAVARRGDRLAVALVRLTDEVAKTVSENRWYEITFTEDDDVRVEDETHFEDEQDAEEVDEPADEDSGTEQDASVAEDAAASENLDVLVESIWDEVWKVRRIWFIRVGPELRRWSTGSVIDEKNFATVVRTSPAEAAADLFFQVPEEVASFLYGAFFSLAGFFLFIYAGAVALALYHIVAITWAASRLTRGSREVQGGKLDYRIPVKRRDQLGDLAVAFNRMTESVASMLDEVAEKERLKNELELAREIQQSLLPSRHLEHGTISVNAYFRPAAEVGGDYFDLFPLERGRLIVAAGDVAGHGLPTGLLMAMVKSAVATLVHEGHRGRELLERVNRFMLEQPREHRMVTLAIADVDVEAGVAAITNAAHPPVYLSGGTVREVMLPALPVGYKWPKPPPTETLTLGPDSRLVFYSDGLVEAVDENEQQLGYERLRELLREHAGLSSEELLARLLKDLEEHTGGRPLDDDLTILIIDCAVPR